MNLKTRQTMKVQEVKQQQTPNREKILGIFLFIYLAIYMVFLIFYNKSDAWKAIYAINQHMIILTLLVFIHRFVTYKLIKDLIKLTIGYLFIMILYKLGIIIFHLEYLDLKREWIWSGGFGMYLLIGMYLIFVKNV